MRALLASLLVPLLTAGCLPNPQSVKERREQFDRDSLRGKYILDAPPADMVKVDAEFGKAKLLGYVMDPATPKPGDRVEITFFWSATGLIPEDYEVFVHGDAIVGNSSRIHGDHYPADGKYPTDVWQENEVVTDRFTLWVPPGYGGKQLGVFVGLYLGNYRVPLTNRGLKEADSENRSRAITMSF